ncbi:hypothetical protein U1Q18_049953, partial [Sarracenia purpurea var. burkii]
EKKGKRRSATTGVTTPTLISGLGFTVHATSNQLCPAGSVDDPRKWESNPFKWVKLLLQWMRKKEGNRTATVVSVAHHQLPFRFKEFDFLLR